MAAIHQQFRSSGGSGGERPLPAPPASPRWSGVTLGAGGQADNNGADQHGSQDQAEGAAGDNVLVAPPESS